MTNPLKIGLITDNYPAFMTTGKSPAGGIGTYTQLVAEDLASRGHEVHVFAYAPVKQLERQESASVTIWGCPTWTQRRDMGAWRAVEFTLRYRWRHHPSRFPLLLAVREAARGRRFDVIEAPDMAAMGAIVQRSGLTDRFAVRLHSTVSKGGGNRLAEGPPERRRALKACLLSADVVTAPTRYVLESTLAQLEGGLECCEVVGNPIRVRPFGTHTVEHPERAVFFGRLIRAKGVDLLGAAVPLVREQVKDFTVSFIGPDLPWRPEKRRASAVIREKAQRDSAACDIRGQLSHDQLHHEVGRYAVAALPSRWETFGMALLEAMAWGVPVLASDIPPFVELTDHGQVGARLFKAESVEELAQTLVDMIRNPISENQRRAAHEHAARWSVDRVASQLLDVWRCGKCSGTSRAHERTEALPA